MDQTITCTKCGHSHDESVNFCTGCGAALGDTCPSCGAEMGPDARFCGQCGRKLGNAGSRGGRAETSDTAITRTRGAEPSGLADKESERRLLTVMFSDLVDSTVLASKLDPEELQDVLRAYQEASSEAIEDLDGYIAHYLGDGIIAFFGYPQSHEDEAARAVKAALRILDELDALNRELLKSKGYGVRARVGIHTGLTVLGDVSTNVKQETLAFGDTPAIACRIQSEASPGSLVISHETLKLVGNKFEFKSLGQRELKGVPGKMELYEVIRGSEKVDYGR